MNKEDKEVLLEALRDFINSIDTLAEVIESVLSTEEDSEEFDEESDCEDE